MTPKVVLTIAGSDSGGGAGLQADLRCFAALGVHGTCAITAVTAQNTVGVHSVQPLLPSLVDAQLAAVMSDLTPAAAKTGMLATTEIMEVVASWAALPGFPALVVDPVMIASSGARLLDEKAERAFLSLLFPLATVATPNLHEAARLVGSPVTNLDEMTGAARQLHRRGPRWVVITGGHLGGSVAADVVFDGCEITVLRQPRVDSRNLHGTGCTFSAAIAAHLALGHAPLEAIAAAKHFVSAAIRGARDWSLGAGEGPLDPNGWGS